MPDKLREQLVVTARAMNASGLNRGTAGNVSARWKTGMLITPSGVAYADMTVEDLVCMDFNGGSDGRYKPSSEWRFHAAIYQHLPEAQAVVHAHPRFGTALACLGKGIPAFHYMVAVAGGKDIRCADYATFGTPELAANLLAALQGRKACLMAHHGLTCYGQDLEQALDLAQEVEQLAAIYCQILAIGEPVILDDDEMGRVVEKFKGYGQRAHRT